jgi:general secretion pathway protein E
MGMESSVEKSKGETRKASRYGVFHKVQGRNLGEVLIEAKLITPEQLQEALTIQAAEKKRLGQILIEREWLTEEQMLKALALQLDLPYYDKLPVNEIDPELIKDVPIQFSRDNLILPIAKDAFNVTVAVGDPLNIFPMDDLRLIMSTNINMIVSSPTVITSAINRVYERLQDTSQKVISELTDIEEGEDLEETKDLLESTDDEKPIIRLVNGLLSRAVKDKASDIHIEPYENEIVVRSRVDGTLHDTMQLPKRHMNSIVSRIKIIGKLNIAEKRIPQDGRISVKVAGKDIDVRLSVLPVAHGERVVMRILDKTGGVKRIDEMGLDDSVRNQWKSLVASKHGIILVTGPTGSGKTTLLYGSVMEIVSPEINVLTIEDPVEYRLPGVGQIDVKSKIGLTFGEGLRAILRQDPDVIMVGEIRDKETSSIAVQASLTGHLVFSTLHTNDSASAVTRMNDLGVQPFQIASALLGVMATRLIRRLCPNCKEKYTLTERDIKLLELTPSQVAGKQIYRAGKGCEKCRGIAYMGRMGIHELLIMTDELRDLVQKTQDSHTIKKVAIEKGMLTLRQSAVQKVLNGLTSIDEAMQKTQTEELEVDEEVSAPAVENTTPGE